MNKTVIENYAKLNLSLLYLPLFFLFLIGVFFYKNDVLYNNSYASIQKGWFFSINSELSQYPNLIYNLTQLGDALIFLSFLAIFIIYAPKIWEALISASLISILFSSVLKNIFKMPRPAAIYDPKKFTIIGDTLTGSNSLPSGHSITIFTVFTVLLFAFMPQRLKYKILWCSSVLMIGFSLVFTRVGVGAHYPIDVITGSIIGYISGVLGIFINQKYSPWKWISNKKYYPFFIVLFIICIIVLITKLMHTHLVIFYLSIVSLLISLYIITHTYAKK